MTIRFNRARSSPCNGLTLVEVVASTALLATLLTFIMIASTDHVQQIKTANVKRKCIAQLEDFLTSWALESFSPEAAAIAADHAGLVLRDQRQAINTDVTLPRGKMSVTLQQRPSDTFGRGLIVRITVSPESDSLSPLADAWAEIQVLR